MISYISTLESILEYKRDRTTVDVVSYSYVDHIRTIIYVRFNT